MGAAPEEPGTAFDLLAQLVDESLVVTQERRGQVRYALLETLRQYGAEYLTSSGESPTMRRAHLAWCLALAEVAEVGLSGPEQVEWIERLEADHENLRAALLIVGIGREPACSMRRNTLMGPHRPTWAIWMTVISLMVLLSACGGGNTTNSTSTTSTSTPSSAGNTNLSTKSTVSFTASGGLSGAYTISDTNRDSSYRTSSLNFIVQDQTWLFTLGNTSYTGPGAYILAGLPKGYIGLQSVAGAQRWQLASPATCQMTVTADTALRTGGGGPPYHEVKGTFSCSSLASQSDQPLTLSNGQFDIVALAVS